LPIGRQFFADLKQAKKGKKLLYIKGISGFAFFSPSLLIFNTDIYSVTFLVIKEKANAKGNGDWHLRKNSTFILEAKKL